MLYIIGGIILFIILAVIGGEGGIGCFFFLLITFVLWRIGILGFIINIVLRVLRWIGVRLVYYYEKFFGADEGVAYLSKVVVSLLI